MSSKTFLNLNLYKLEWSGSIFYFFKGDVDERGYESGVLIGVEDQFDQAVYWSRVYLSPTGEHPAHLSPAQSRVGKLPGGVAEHAREGESHQSPGPLAEDQASRLDQSYESNSLGVDDGGQAINHCVMLQPMYLQVCEVYKLQRETFYLAIDMYERFMAAHTGIHKEHLQKIGVTCLFAAAKLEVCFI